MSAATREGRRPDVEGLRGVAIALVVLYHSGLPVTGGYVGVDVFLVISGFLITGLLLRELEQTGSISLSAFYARRIRRLLPAASVALVVTMAWSAVALSPLDQPEAMADATAAALSVANLRFAAEGLDYFTADRTPSPVLHFWSLSVEEQFYVVWPGLLLAVAWVSRRLGGRPSRVAGGVALGAIAGLGLAASIALAGVAPTWGFYSLPSRAWEFALGGLVAVGSSAVQRIPRRVSLPIGWLAAVLLLASAVRLDDSVPYPGAAATLPTAAATGLVVAGAQGGVGRVLSAAPLQFLGRISYSLYLWHWPFLVLPAAMAGRTLDGPATGAMLGLAIVVAWLSRRFVELPFLGISSTRPNLARASLRLGAAALAALVVVSSGLQALAVEEVAHAGGPETGPVAAIVGGNGLPGASTRPEVSPSESRRTEPGAGSVEDAGPVADGSAPVAGQSAPVAASPAATTASTAETPPPGSSPAASAPAATPLPWTAIRAAPLPANVSLPDRVQPALASARSDEERLIRDGCFTWPDGTVPARCVYGVSGGTVTVALIGDSHASHWFPALNVLAARNKWRLLPFAKASCPFIDVPVFHPLAERRYTECEAWRDRVVAAVNAARPDLVIVADAYYAANGPIDPDERSLKAKGLAMAKAIGRLRAGRVAIMVDNPRTDTDVPACLARYPHDVNRCAIPRAEAFPSRFGVVERVAASASGATLIDITASICPSTPCPVVRDGMILYRDGHHLTATFSRSLAGPIGAAIKPLLAKSPAGASSPAPAPTTSATLIPAPVPTAAPATSAAPSPGAAAAPPPAAPATGVLLRDAGVTAGIGGRGALEPVIAAHPTDPDRLAIAYGRRSVDAGCGVAAISAGIALTRDGGRTWRQAARLPTDGTDRVPSYHSALAWGPGPRAGSTRLYWTGTTTRRCGGDLRVAAAWSDDEGRTWSRLAVMRSTPPWVGGDPDITVDRNPASPGFGTVWLTYNYPLGGAAGSGIRVVASGDFGRTWIDRAVARAAYPAGYPATWRFASRVRAGPDGAAYISWYQADLRRWDPGNVFGRGGAANVGSLGFAIARVQCRARCAGLLVGSPVMATRIPENAWTLGLADLPGAGSHGYGDPMWSHGLDVDPVTGTVYLAVAEVARASGGGPLGTVRVGRSADRGQTWAWTRLPVAMAAGAAQSAVRPGVAARGGVVVAGFRTVGAKARGSTLAMVGYGWSASRDGGRSFAAPVVPAGGRWPALNLDAQLNGPGTRDRLDWAAGSAVVFAIGDGRTGDGAARAVHGEVRLVVIGAGAGRALGPGSARRPL